ncbi:unnamed protein product [Didymodactylos carnosus]|uniref:Uncharacterized protein n=3 Tax=Didymodactylos carnosus TaxID=1234261 RepID=A0A8S2F2G9_9BILA|nr:unnamed protein product [Didymodactylos carnosus]CAF4186133.1 unnamed protein product [Didymodactylos carnosus]
MTTVSSSFTLDKQNRNMNEQTQSSNNKKDYIKRRRISIINEYLISTSTHGLKSLGLAYNSCHFLFWLLTFTFACGLMLYFIVQCLIEYYHYPTQTIIEITSETELNFPAITFCNSNPFRYDKINESYNNYLLNTNCSYINNDVYCMKQFINNLFNSNNQTQIINYGYDINDLLVGCNYNILDCSNQSKYTQFMSPSYGNCFTFNAQLLANNGENKLLLATTTTSSGDNNVEFTDSSMIYFYGGGTNCLFMSFYINEDLYYPNLYTSKGLTAIIHNNNEIPLIDSKAFYFAPGYTHNLVWTKSVSTYLEPPYTSCTNIIGDDMKALYDAYNGVEYSYSQTVCYELCKQTYIYMKCQCISSLILTIQKLLINNQLIHVNMCSIYPTLTQMMCAYSAMNNFTYDLKAQSQLCKQCQQECEITTYTSQITSSTDSLADDGLKTLIEQTIMKYRELPQNWTNNWQTYIDNSYLQLQICPQSEFVHHYKQEPSLSWTDVISSVGGQTAL